MKKFLLRCLGFFAVLVIVAQVVGYVMDDFFGDFNNKRLDHRAPWIFQQEGQELDYVVLGSSRALNVIDINTIDSTLGTTGMNIASSGSSPAQNYLFLRRFHEHGNSFNTVIMNVDWSNFHSDSAYSYPFSDYAFMPLMSEGWVADIYYDEVSLWKYATWRTLPMMKYAEFNNKYPMWESLRHRHYEYSNELWDSTRGSHLLFDSVRNFWAMNPGSIHYFSDADEVDLKYFYTIADWCKEKNIQLICTTSPYTAYYMKKRDASPNFRGIDSVCRLKEIPYYNHSLIPLSRRKGVFRDHTHLNGHGGRKYSVYLAKVLRAEGVI